MNCPDYNSPQALKAILDENGMAMQKKFGQNFMINSNARTQIIRSLDLHTGDSVWEIGPGLGAMTSEIMQKSANLTAFEIDRGFISLLHKIFAEEEKKGQFKIIEGDVLKNWEKEASSCGEKISGIKLFGNLPYNIAASFIADTITANITFNRCVFTVQKEVADRMRAKPSTKDYSAFSVLCQWMYDVTPGIVLSSASFWPRPNVASQAVLFTPKMQKDDCPDTKLFVKLVHALFSQRRKTLLNNIKPILPQGVSGDEFFEKAGVSKAERAENLTIEQFSVLTKTLFSLKNTAENL